MYKRKHDGSSVDPTDKQFKSEFGKGHTLDSDEEDGDIAEEQ